MTASNQTSLGLPQWKGSDYLKREAMNGAFSVIDNELVHLHNHKVIQGTESPSNTENLWLDLNIKPGTLKRYDEEKTQWVEALRMKSDRISAEEHGASTDLEDNSPYFQSALNQARDNGGGTVYIPAGTWKVKQPLLIYSNTTLQMEESTILLRNAEINNLLRNADSGNEDVILDTANISIVGGVLDGNSPTFNASTALLAISRNSNLRVYNTTFQNISGGNFIKLASSTHIMVEQSRFYNSTSPLGECIEFLPAKNAGVYPWLTAYSNTPVSFVTIKNCYFNNVGTAIGSHIVGELDHTRITIHDNIMTNLGDAIKGLDWALVQIRDNHIDAAGTGITLETAGVRETNEVPYVKIEKNVLRNLNKATYSSCGIVVKGLDSGSRYSYVSIQDNSVSSVERHGIELYAVDNCIVSGNTVAFTNYGGIFASNTKYGQISGNHVRNVNRANLGWHAIFLGHTSLTNADTTQMIVSGNVVETLRISRSTIVSVLDNMIFSGASNALFVDTDATLIKRRNNWIHSVFEETA